MAVVSCHLIDDSFSKADRKTTYTATFRIKTDDPEDTGVEAANGALSALPDPLPSYFASYSLNGSSDPSAFAQTFTSRRMSRDSARCYHEVDVTWSPMENPDDDWDNSQDPLTRPVRIEPYEEEREELVEEAWNVEALTGLTPSRDADTFGPICNGAGCQPPEALTRKRIIPGLRFIKNVATIADFVALRDAYVGQLNDDDFYDAPMGKALCSSVTSSAEMEAAGAKYREVTIDVLADPKGHYAAMVNCGMKFLEDDELKEATVNDANDDEVPAAEPINLELDGTPTPDGELASVIHWRVNDFADYSGLGVGG